MSQFVSKSSLKELLKKQQQMFLIVISVSGDFVLAGCGDNLLQFLRNIFIDLF